MVCVFGAKPICRFKGNALLLDLIYVFMYVCLYMRKNANYKKTACSLGFKMQAKTNVVQF